MEQLEAKKKKQLKILTLSKLTGNSDRRLSFDGLHIPVVPYQTEVGV